jgi:hypothetical protein
MTNIGTIDSTGILTSATIKFTESVPLGETLTVVLTIKKTISDFDYNWKYKF